MKIKSVLGADRVGGVVAAYIAQSLLLTTKAKDPWKLKKKLADLA